MRGGERPATRFAKTPSGSSIAYQLIGGHPVSVVSVPPMAQNIEMAWEWPAIRKMFEGFAEFCSFVPFDKRGTGMSNRSLDIPRLDERVDELSAVLDDAGLDDVFLMGTSEGGPMALMFAATYPERVRGVILESSAAWLGPPPEGSSGGWSPEDRERFADGWGTTESITADLFAPSLAGNVEFRRWHERYERNAASRDAIGALIEMSIEMDARGVLHRVECPVLMLHRVGDRVVPVEAARATRQLLESHGVRVELIETPGCDHFLYAADMAVALEAIERFTTGGVSARANTWATNHVEIVAMGRFDVAVDGRTVPTSQWGSRRARLLLQRLVVARGHAVTRDELIDVLWPHDVDVARLGPRLSVQLSAVRRVLRGGIVADRATIRLDLDHVNVDIEQWFRLTDDASIVTGHHGEFVPEARYHDWATPLRDEIKARYLSAVHRLASTATGPDAIELWQSALRHDPYDERSHRSLVATLRNEGREGDARRAYQALVAAMDDLGVRAPAWDELAAP